MKNDITTTKRIFALRNCRYSHKRVRPILHNISGKNVFTALAYLAIDKRPSSTVIAKFLLSTVSMDKRTDDGLKSILLSSAYATTGFQRQGIMRGSRGTFGRQKGRTSHIFFVIS